MSTDSIFISKYIDELIKSNLTKAVNTSLIKVRNAHIVNAFTLISNEFQSPETFLEKVYGTLPSTISSVVFSRIRTIVISKLVSLIADNSAPLHHSSRFIIDLFSAYLCMNAVTILHKSDPQFTVTNNTFSDIYDSSLCAALSTLYDDDSFDFSGKYPRLRMDVISSTPSNIKPVSSATAGDSMTGVEKSFIIDFNALSSLFVAHDKSDVSHVTVEWLQSNPDVRLDITNLFNSLVLLYKSIIKTKYKQSVLSLADFECWFKAHTRGDLCSFSDTREDLFNEIKHLIPHHQNDGCRIVRRLFLDILVLALIRGRLSRMNARLWSISSRVPNSLKWFDLDFKLLEVLNKNYNLKLTISALDPTCTFCFELVTELDKLTPPTPTEIKENNMSIINRTKPAVEHITFIHGVSINDLNVSTILNIIREKEADIAALKVIENAPKRVKKEIKRIEAEIKDIVAELDKLEDE